MGGSMTKAELINQVAKEARISKASAEKAINSLTSNVAKCLKRKDKITLTGFGTFMVSKRRARTGRNLLADLQAGGLTNSMLSALTPTWQAFKGNRSRHIATYNDSLQRMVGRGEVTPPPQNVTPQVATEVQAPKITVSGGGFRPTGRDTVYGRAFDAAGTKT
ncbi:HU family DNA-binding protein, partial [bacterium]